MNAYARLTYHSGRDVESLRKYLNGRVVNRVGTLLRSLVLGHDGTSYLLEIQGASNPFVGQAPTKLGPYDFTVGGFEYLMTRLGMPANYFTHTSPPDITLMAANRHLRALSDVHVNVCTEGSTVTAVLTDRHVYTAHESFVDDIALIPHVGIASWSCSEQDLRVAARGRNDDPKVVKHLSNGDEVILSMLFTNSENGFKSLGLEAQLYRVKGVDKSVGVVLMPPEFGSFRKAHLGSPKGLTAEYANVWAKMTRGFSAVAKRLEKMIGEPMTPEEVSAVAGEVCDILKLPGNLRSEFLSRVGGSVYNVWNALVETASLPAAAGHAEAMRKAAGRWVIDAGAKNPLFITP